eukprot:COSAG01_NODE_1126_length_11588_cov_40.954652_9_plen_501_part_00
MASCAPINFRRNIRKICVRVTPRAKVTEVNMTAARQEYPLSRNAPRNGRGPRPMTQMSKNHVDEDECDRRIEYSIPPGALAFVHQPGKHGGAQDISNGRWSRCVGIDKDTPIFEQVPKPPLGKTYRSKNFKVYDLKPGLSAYEFMGHPPPSPLPKGAVDPPAAELRGVHIVRLSGLFEQSKPQMMPQVQGVTNSTESPIQFMTIDACGRILQSDGDVMRPTGGMVQVIPAEVVQPEDLKRQREVLAECLDKYPEYLIGHEVHKFVPEWNAVARGRIIKYDANETWWIVKYDTDHKTSDFDKEQVLKYAINREDGESEPDGGLAAMLRYQDKPGGDFNIQSDSDGSPEDVSVPGSGGDSTNLEAQTSNSNSNSYGAVDSVEWGGGSPLGCNRLDRQHRRLHELLPCEHQAGGQTVPTQAPERTGKRQYHVGRAEQQLAACTQAAAAAPACKRSAPDADQRGSRARLRVPPQPIYVVDARGHRDQSKVGMLSPPDSAPSKPA